MEAFAAMLSYTDDQFGRLLDELERRGELANTLIIVTSDNGASAEGGPGGLLTEAYLSNEQAPTQADNMRYYDKWGGPETYPTYHFGWAVAGNTPFRYYKQTTYEGGRSEEHTSELQSLMRISYAVFCLKKKTITTI